jgi:hypothetical protein
MLRCSVVVLRAAGESGSKSSGDIIFLLQVAVRQKAGRAGQWRWMTRGNWAEYEVRWIQREKTVSAYLHSVVPVGTI